MVFELSDYTNHREMTTVGALYDFLTSKSGDDFLSWTMVLMHFPENANNHGPRDNVFWGSCPGLGDSGAQFDSKPPLDSILLLGTTPAFAGPSV
jgi:hypothetical protein